MIRKIKTTYRLLFIILVTLVLSAIPLILRVSNGEPVLATASPYYHIRVARSIQGLEVPSLDSLSYGGRPNMNNPYHYLLYSVSWLTDIEHGSLLLSLVASILSLLTLNLILKKLEIESTIVFYSLLVLALSPAFIYAATIPNSYIIAICLSLIGMYLFPKEGKILSMLSLAFLIFSSTLDGITTVLAMALLFTYTLNNKKYTRKATLFGTGISAALLLRYIPLLLKHGFPNLLSPVQRNLLGTTISDLGAIIGFSPFMIILALIGLFLTWKNKRRIYPLFLAIILVSIVSPYLHHINIQLTIIFSVFAGIAMDKLTRMRYQIKLMKRLTILLIFCGLIFSSMSFINRIVQSDPHADTWEALTWLKDNEEPGIVLSDYGYGHWITYVSGFPAYTDPHFLYAPDLKKRFSTTTQIFNSSTLSTARQLLVDNNIDYIFIDENIKETTFKDSRTGLLYLTRNNETFKSIYSSNGVEIWSILK